jgi:hypothetical protein
MNCPSCGRKAHGFIFYPLPDVPGKQYLEVLHKVGFKARNDPVGTSCYLTAEKHISHVLNASLLLSRGYSP